MRRPGQVLVTVGCAYEIVALWTGLPTITAMVKRIGRHPVGRLIVWAWCGYIAWHFLEPDS